MAPPADSDSPGGKWVAAYVKVAAGTALAFIVTVSLLRWASVLEFLIWLGVLDTTAQFTAQLWPTRDERTGRVCARIAVALAGDPMLVRRFLAMNVAILMVLMALLAMPATVLVHGLRGIAAIVGILTRHRRTELRRGAGLRSAAAEDGVIYQWIGRLEDLIQAPLEHVLGAADDSSPRPWLALLLVAALGATFGVADETRGWGLAATLTRDAADDLAVLVDPTDSGDVTESGAADEDPFEVGDRQSGLVGPVVSETSAALPCADDIQQFLDELRQLAPKLDQDARERAMQAWLEVGATVAGCPWALLDHQGGTHLVGLRGATTGPTAVHVSPTSAAIVYSDELGFVERNFETIREIHDRISSGGSTFQLVEFYGSECTVLARPVNEAPSIPPSAIATSAFVLASEGGGSIRGLRLVSEAGDEQVWEVLVTMLSSAGREVEMVSTVAYLLDAGTARLADGRHIPPGCPKMEELSRVRHNAETIRLEAELRAVSTP